VNGEDSGEEAERRIVSARRQNSRHDLRKLSAAFSKVRHQFCSEE